MIFPYWPQPTPVTVAVAVAWVARKSGSARGVGRDR
jgi:hypothetical protein